MEGNIPKLYTAFAEFLFTGIYIVLFRKYQNTMRTVIMIPVVAVLLCLIQIFCGHVSNVLWLAGMFAAFAVMNLMLGNCLNLKWRTCIHMACRAFMLAELAASFEWQVYYYYFYERSNDSRPVSILFCILVYLVFAVIGYWGEKRVLPDNLERSFLEVPRRDLLFTVVITVVIFAMSNMSYVYVKTPFTDTRPGSVYNIRTLLDLVGYLVLYTLNLQRMDTNVRTEAAAIQNLFQNQYVQFKQSQENIDLINRKYHDMKNQLQVIRMEQDSDKRLKYLDEIEAGIRKYELENKTGNAALDTILTEKSSQCEKYGITMTSVADGKLLAFMHVMDMCTLFGNALDNAMEYEVQVQEPEKRLIHLSVAEKKGFVTILIENPFEGVLDVQEGLPVTTKKDTRNHGYGMKSIRQTVEKYGGFMDIEADDGWFCLRILFPVHGKL